MPVSVMAVDDSTSVLESLKWIFEDEPYRIFTFENPLDALNLMKAVKFPIVLVEHHMREIDGIIFLKKVKERSPQTIGILMTGYTGFIASLDRMYAGCVFKYVRKPIDKNEVRRVLRMAVTQWEINHERNSKINSVLAL